MNNFTKRVIQAYRNIEDERSKYLVQKFIEYLHDYIIDVQLKDREWEFCWTAYATLFLFVIKQKSNVNTTCISNSIDRIGIQILVY